MTHPLLLFLLKHRNGINQTNGDALCIRSIRAQGTGTVGQTMAFMQKVPEYLQIAVVHWEVLHATLQVPGSAVQTLFKKSVGLVYAGCFISTLHVYIPMTMNAIVKISNERQVFRIHRCGWSKHSRSLHVADDAMTVQRLSGIHDVQVSDNRTFLVYIRSCQVQHILAYRLLSPRSCITQLYCLVCKQPVPVQSRNDRKMRRREDRL